MAEGIELGFKCPEDFDIDEFTELVNIIGDLYAKFQLLDEGRLSPFDAYVSRRWRWRGFKPKERMILQKMGYGSDFSLVVTAGKAIYDVMTIFALVWALKTAGFETFDWWKQEGMNKELKDILTKTSDKKLRGEVEGMAERRRMTIERMLQYVSPELERAFKTRAKYKRQT